MIAMILRNLRILFRWLPDRRLTKALYGHLKAEGIPVQPGPFRTVAIEGVEAHYFYGLFTALAGGLARRTAIRTDLLLTRSVDVIPGATLKAFIWRMFPIAYLMTLPWIRAYRVRVDRVGYRSVSWGQPLTDTVAQFQAWQQWRNLKSVRQLETMTVDGILVGDLIIDSYLRYRPAVTVEIADWYMLQIVWQACREVKRSRRYFRRVAPSLYLTSYSTYVQHGVPARVAMAVGIPVFSFGNLQQLGKRLSIDDPYHTKNPTRYRTDFAMRPDREALLDQARTQLETRLSGGIDAATAYMTVSAYKTATEECPDVMGAVVLFLHDFYDSPHVYPDLLFPDFWTWVCHTITVLQQTGLRFLIKPHPNQIALSSTVIPDLLAKFPGAALIPAAITNKQLAEGGMTVAVTVYGTVAHEMAYLGIPSIACARHPHVAFDFCYTAKNLAEYDALLKQAGSLHFEDPAAMRHQVLEFYAMHNLELSAEEQQTRSALTEFFRIVHDPAAPTEQIVRQIALTERTAGFQNLITTLEASLRGPQTVSAGAHVEGALT